jgi:hypothetical protein
MEDPHINLAQVIVELTKCELHEEIKKQFNLLFSLHLELIRDKLRDTHILLMHKNIIPIQLVDPLENIIHTIKTLQKNRFKFHLFIKKNTCEENLAETIDPLISEILDLKEEITGYYQNIKITLFTFYKFPLEYVSLINHVFEMLQELIDDFNYPTPSIMNAAKKRIKEKNDAIMTQWEST